MAASAYVDYLSLGIAVAQFALAALVVAEGMRVRRFPALLLVLALYFVLRGAARLNDPDPFLGHRPALATAFDALALVILVILLANARRLARAAAATADEAAFRAAEYERARRDYARLVQHRLLNPLMIIRGAAETLKAGREEGRRGELLDAVIEATDRIERETLDPSPRSSEEEDLAPRPRVR